AALALTEPEKKLDALAKFLVDFPNVSKRAIRYVVNNYLNTLFQKFSGKNDKILEYANKLIKSAPEDSRPDTYNSVALEMLNAGILLDKSEEFAARGLALLDEALAKRDREARASNLATLGRIYQKEGKIAEAKKALVDAYTADTDLTDAAIALAKIEADAGNYAAALDYLVSVALSGDMESPQRQQLEAVYKQL